MKIDRLVGIIMTLLRKKRIGAQELADLFEVSPRTIYRDIDAISRAGIPIRSISGVGGGFEMMPAYKIEKHVFSTADLSAIWMGLSHLSNLVPGDEITTVLGKIKWLIPDERARDVARKTNQIQIDWNAWWGNPRIQPYLQRIKTAVEEHKPLSFGYIAHRGNQTVRTVEPYQLVWKNGHWYLYGYCDTRRDYRLFRLSRMSDLEVKQTPFVPRAYQAPVLDFEEHMETMQTEIKIRIQKSVLDRVLEFCTWDRFEPDGDEHYLVDFPFIENEYYYDILLSFGDKCECLEPAHIRANMEQRIQDITAMYGK